MMTAAKTIAVSFVTSVLVSAIITTMMFPSNETTTFPESPAAMDEQLTLLEQDLQDIRNKLITEKDLAASQSQFLTRANLRDLEAIVDQLRDLLGKSKAANPALKVKTPSRREVTELIERKLEESEAGRKLRVSTKERETALAWLRKSTKKKSLEIAKRLSLNANQADRLTLALETQALSSAPLWGTIKDDEATAQDRLQAIAQMRINSREMFDQLRSVLSTSQYEEFEADQLRADEKVNNWFEVLETELRTATK